MIELGYDSEADEYGVHDGVKLARQLVADAYRLLIPYGNACPTCVDELMRAVSAEVAKEIGRTGMTSIVLSDSRRGLDKAAASAAHLRAAQARVAEVLRGVALHDHATTLRRAG